MTIIAPFKELTILKLAKENKLKNPNNIINKSHVPIFNVPIPIKDGNNSRVKGIAVILFKHSLFNLNPLIKNFRN